MVGPTAGATQWAAPCDKYSLRASGIGSIHAPVSISAYLYNAQAVSVLQYIAQFREPPERMIGLERIALHRILHFATNSLTRNGYLNLVRLGGPSLRSVQCTCRAALFTSSMRFKPTWQAWMGQIRKAVHDHGTLRESAEGMLSPSFWDSLPMAASLEAAYAGWPKEEGFDVPIQNAKIEITNAKVALNEVSCRPHKVAVQAIAYRHLFKFLHPDDNHIVLGRRLRFILGTFCADGWLDAVAPLLSQLKCFESVQVLRTWSNSWSTSHRYHETHRLPCLLGMIAYLTTQVARYFISTSVPLSDMCFRLSV